MVIVEEKINLNVMYVPTNGQIKEAKKQTIRNTIISGYLVEKRYQK